MDTELAVIWADDYSRHIKELNKKINNLEMRFLIDNFFLTSYKIEVFKKDIFHHFILESKIKGEIIMNENLPNKYIYFIKTGQIELSVSTDIFNLIEIIKIISEKAKIKYEDYKIDLSKFSLLISDIKDIIFAEMKKIRNFRVL